LRTARRKLRGKMNAQLKHPEAEMSFDALVEQEERSDVRHQFINGRLCAMSDLTPRHADIGTNLSAAIGLRLRGKACRGSSGEQRVRVSEDATNWFYPDFLIKCPPQRFHPRDKNALLNPSAIFEVLSPETEKFDRTGKFDEFKAIAELSDYVLIDTERARVEHFSRGEGDAWAQRVYTRLDQDLRLDNFSISVPLAEIYEDVPVGEQGTLFDLSAV
jgi:Uma2 family endonuclease